MAILYKGGGEGTKTPAQRKAESDRMRAELSTKDDVMPMSGVMGENDYLYDSYPAISSAFKTKYPDVNYAEIPSIKKSIYTSNPDATQAQRADMFHEQMTSKYGDLALTQDEWGNALTEGGRDRKQYFDSLTTMQGKRLSELGQSPTGKGDTEGNLSNAGWRMLGYPGHSAPAGKDYFHNQYNE